MNNILIKIIFLMIGAIIGVLIVKEFVLVDVEKVFFDMVLDAIDRGGHWSDRELELLFKSDTFAKIALGFVIGAVVGIVSYSRFYKK